jgi:hypothetical protein
MRNTKFFVGSEQVASNSIQMVDGHSWTKWGVPGMAFPGKRMHTPVAVSYESSLQGAGRRLARFVAYNPNGSKHKCDSRCLNAKGGNCECSCGGANHGAGHQ